MNKIDTSITAYMGSVSNQRYEYWDGTQFVPGYWFDLPSGVYMRWTGNPKIIRIKTNELWEVVTPVPKLIQAYLLLEGN